MTTPPRLAARRALTLLCLLLGACASGTSADDDADAASVEPDALTSAAVPEDLPAPMPPETGDPRALPASSPPLDADAPATAVDASLPLAEPAPSGDAAPEAPAPPTEPPGGEATPPPPDEPAPEPAPPTAPPSAPEEPPPPAPAAGCGAPEEVALVDRLNAARAAAGVGAVVCDATVKMAATAHTADMCARDYFALVSPDGVGPGERLAAAGAAPDAWAVAIAGGHPDVAGVDGDWSAHPGDALDPDLHRVAVSHDPCGGDHFWARYLTD